MNLVARLKLGSGMLATLLALVAPAAAVAQSEAGSDQSQIVTIATSELPSSPSSVARTEVATSTPAGPSVAPASFPPAPALIAAVRNEQRIGQERPTLPKKKFFSLMALQHSAVAFDTWSTRRLVDSGGRELNPILKPIAHSDALYPVMQA